MSTLTAHLLSPAGIRQLVNLPTVLIPAYKPDPSLPSMVSELLATGRIGAVVVVDDGSGPAYQDLFLEMSRIEGVHILRHVVNLGKGAALKTGLNYIGCTLSSSISTVTADADGQHLLEDILQVAEATIKSPDALILGSRTFGKNVPARSKFGNITTRIVMRIFTGMSITDTQTGLRGIPAEFIKDLVRIKSVNYDFELDMLLSAKQTNRKIIEIPIQTVYINENKASHFSPVLDSMRIYFVFLRYSAVSITVALVDNIVFLLCFHQTNSMATAQILGRLAAISIGFLLVKNVVFKSTAALLASFVKFLSVATISGLISYGAINYLHYGLKINVVFAKPFVEGVLFFGNFLILRDLIFRKKDAA